VTRFTVDVLPEAERELREAFLWYFERSPIAADATVRTIADQYRRPSYCLKRG